MWYYCEISMGYKSGSEKSGDVTGNGGWNGNPQLAQWEVEGSKYAIDGPEK